MEYLFYTLEVDFNTLLGDTIKERYSFLSDRLKTLKNWLCESVGGHECFVVGQVESLSSLIVGDSEPIGDCTDCRTRGPGLDLCKELGYEPRYVFLTSYGTDIITAAYSDKVPQGELWLIAKGWSLGQATMRIKNLAI
jgi:hypothetical protein